jgi:hypothetical protein
VEAYRRTRGKRFANHGIGFPPIGESSSAPLLGTAPTLSAHRLNPHRLGRGEGRDITVSKALMAMVVAFMGGATLLGTLGTVLGHPKAEALALGAVGFGLIGTSTFLSRLYGAASRPTQEASRVRA